MRSSVSGDRLTLRQVPPRHMESIIKSKRAFKFRDFCFFILGLVAQRPKVVARQEALAVCTVSEVLEATWCLVWDDYYS